MEQTFVLNDPLGFHARPAAVVVGIFAKAASKVSISAKGKTVDGKSILQVLSLGVKGGDEVTITVEGSDAQEVMNLVIERASQSTPPLFK
jgi:phosphocarrier protein